MQLAPRSSRERSGVEMNRLIELEMEGSVG